MRRSGMLVVVAALFTAVGCASGPSYSDVQDRIPGVPQGMGRIYFMRSGSMFGCAVQPAIYLNDKEVGTSKPGGFFFVDRAPGDYKVTCTTEAKRKLTFSLFAGEIKYVSTHPTFGFFVGHVIPELMNEEDGRSLLAKCSYTGGALPPP